MSGGRLRRTRLEEPGIRRVRSGRGFRYLSEDGSPVTDPECLARIRALVIPPAWTDVWICRHPNGHIQAVGTDSAGRRQYRYHDRWRERRDEEKFLRSLEFARELPRLRSAIEADLALPGFAKDRVLALGIRLIDVGMFRIGGEAYAEEHETYGIATIEKRHVRVRGSLISFDYSAKGGIRRRLTIDDPAVAALVDALRRRRAGGRDLLAWKDGGRWVDVSSKDLNAYLKKHVGERFSAKDFRTWDATLHAAVLCAQAADPNASSAARRRCVTQVLRDVANSLGNTPAVCRKSYVDPRVLERFDGGETIAHVLGAMDQPVRLDRRGRERIEAAVIAMLEGGSALSSAA